MLSSVLMHCYEREGHGSSVLSPMSMTLIECLGTMCVDDSSLLGEVEGECGLLCVHFW